MDVQSDNFMRLNLGSRSGALGEEAQTRGRPTATEARERDRGIDFRDRLRDELAANGRARPKNRPRHEEHGTEDRHNRLVLNNN